MGIASRWHVEENGGMETAVAFKFITLQLQNNGMCLTVPKKAASATQCKENVQIKNKAAVGKYKYCVNKLVVLQRILWHQSKNEYPMPRSVRK
jgi:hypothetical protein